MNRLAAVCLVAVLVSCRPATSPPAAVLQPTLAVPQGSWQLVFHDEFPEGPLATQTWNTDLFGGRTNHPELQYYDTEGFSWSEGALNLVARRQTDHGEDYQSGVITTLGTVEVKYGFVEARVKVPRGKGLWPAFWMYDAKTGSSAEIDMMELLGEAPSRAYLTLHYDGAAGENLSVGTHFDVADYSQDFHVFGVDWEPDKVVWYIDGVERFRATDHIPAVPMYLIFNLAVGGAWPVAPDDPTVFPATYSVDWVRVYQH